MGLTMSRIEDKLRPPAQVRREADRIVFSTEARGLASHSKAVELANKAAAAQRDAEMAIALAQPHRKGRDDPKLAFPLGQFCARYGLRDELYDAGEEYGRRVDQARIAMGLSVGQRAILDAGLSTQTPEQIAARRDLAESRLNEAKGILIQIDRRLPQAMTRLTADASEPYPREEDMLKHGLYRLAVEWGYLKLGVRDQ